MMSLLHVLWLLLLLSFNFLIMVINEKMKLNKFVVVNIPSPRSYYVRLGAGNLENVEFSGDESFRNGNKVDNLALMDEYDKIKQSEEKND